MAEKIKILVCDDIDETRESIKKILSLEESFLLVGEAKNGKEAVALSRQYKPNVILMDINMPEMDGITATEVITLENPLIGIIILSVQGEQEYLRKAMSAGAKEYLIKPFSPDELINAVKSTWGFIEKRRALLTPTTGAVEEKKDPHLIITILGSKGGVGKSLIATNLAVALTQAPEKKVVLVDLDLQFGDVAIMLNIQPKGTIADLAKSIAFLDADFLDSFLEKHEKSGLRILCAPLKPALAELVTQETIDKTLKLLKELFDYVVVDTSSNFAESTLCALDLSDKVLLITTLDLPTLKNSRLAVDTLQSLNYPKEKIMLILNRSDSQTGLNSEQAEKTLSLKIDCNIPSDGKLVVPSVNQGEPFVLMDSESKIAKSIKSMVNLLIGKDTELQQKKKEEKGLGKLFKPFFAR